MCCDGSNDGLSPNFSLPSVEVHRKCLWRWLWSNWSDVGCTVVVLKFLISHIPKVSKKEFIGIPKQGQVLPLSHKWLQPWTYLLDYWIHIIINIGKLILDHTKSGGPPLYHGLCNKRGRSPQMDVNNWSASWPWASSWISRLAKSLPFHFYIKITAYSEISQANAFL